MVKFEPAIREMLKPENVKYLVLKYTGEEILAYVLQNEEDDGLHYYLFSPVKLTNIVHPMTGNVQYLMSEWISQRITDDEGFEINVNDVLVIAGVEKRLRVTYAKFCERIESFKKEQDSAEEMNIEMSVSEESIGEVDPEVGDASDDDAFLEYMSEMLHSPKKSTIH